MNTNNNPEENEPLRRVLREWTVEAPLPPRFQEQVWRRIAQAETRQEATGGTGLWRLLGVLLPRPRFAFAYLALLLVAGGLAGSLSAQIKTHRINSELGSRYVQSIDPYRTDATLP
jgi:hypothetical protein